MKNFALHIPEGVKDYIGEEAALKERIQNTVKTIFRTNSYNLVETPSFEYLDVFLIGEETFQQPSLYHFVSRQGELMALRSDMTRSIARVIGTQNKETFPLQRFCYLSNNFRYPERYQGKLHEFTQAGIELIGSERLEADAEVIKVAVKCLQEVGVSDFTVHIGSGTFLKSILEDLGLEGTEADQVFKAIEAKDAVQLKKVLKGTQMEAEVVEPILELIQCSGQIQLLRSVKAKMPSSKAKEALEKMEQLYDLLEDYGVNEYVVFDFSLMSYGKYYTGMMFQIFTHGVGSALVEGGRYDQLLKKGDKNLPAVGFGMHIQLVIQRLLSQKPLRQNQSNRTLVVSTTVTRKVCQEVSDHLRAQNLIIEKYLSDDLQEALSYAKQVGMGGVLYFKQGEQVEVYNLEKGTVEQTTINQL